MSEKKEKCYSFKEVNEIPKQREKASLYRNILKDFYNSGINCSKLEWNGTAQLDTLQTSLRAALRESETLKDKIKITVKSHKEEQKRVIDEIYLIKIQGQEPKKKK